MSCRRQTARLIATFLFACGCSGGTKYIGSNGETGECAEPGSPPEGLGLDPFYTRYMDAGGVPVLSSANVSDTALARACDATVHVLEKRADVRALAIENGLLVAVIGLDEVLTDLPEYSDLYETNPGVDWNYTVRSLGASPQRPVSSVGEENLLCLTDDLFAGESITIHSLAHGLRSLGIVEIDPE
jgi:alpha-glucosidase